MGQYRVTVIAVGNHGCQREKKDGETVIGCERANCSDCIAREYVRRLKRSGDNVTVATVEHWPAELGGSGGPVDDLLTGKRAGSF